MFGLQFFYWVQIQICKIKAEVYEEANRRDIGEGRLTLFSSRSAEIHLVNDREFTSGGKMYDIVKTKIIKGVKCYYALVDNDEDNDLHALKNAEKNSSDEKSVPGKTIKLYNAKYVAVEAPGPVIYQPFNGLVNLRPVSSFFHYASPFGDIYAPPPDSLLS